MTEQISDIRDNSREESVRSAMEDIALIRRMIDHTEINMHRLGWLFLVYGLVVLAYSLFELFSTVIVAHTATLETAGIYGHPQIKEGAAQTLLPSGRNHYRIYSAMVSAQIL